MYLKINTWVIKFFQTTSKDEKVFNYWWLSEQFVSLIFCVNIMCLPGRQPIYILVDKDLEMTIKN